tara:strand:- start:248 stop:505 length:258 start_codon:yes stop_codon:yes gene_type:complete
MKKKLLTTYKEVADAVLQGHIIQQYTQRPDDLEFFLRGDIIMARSIDRKGAIVKSMLNDNKYNTDEIYYACVYKDEPIGELYKIY